MLKKVLILFVAISCFSCKDKAIKHPQQVVKKSIAKIPEPKTLDIHDCTTVTDTVFRDGDWVKYIPIQDGQYGIQIKLGGIIDTLDYTFGCNQVNGLIPKVFRKDKELILCSGQAFTYRKIIVCRKNKDSISYAQFESDRVHSEAEDYFVFETQGKLCFYNRENQKESYREIPTEFKDLKVIRSEVYDKKIIIFFENEKTLDVVLPKSMQ